jgi:hypothetical protein
LGIDLDLDLDLEFGFGIWIWSGMVWYGMVWYGMGWDRMVWFGLVWDDMGWYFMAAFSKGFGIDIGWQNTKYLYKTEREIPMKKMYKYQRKGSRMEYDKLSRTCIRTRALFLQSITAHLHLLSL